MHFAKEIMPTQMDRSFKDISILWLNATKFQEFSEAARRSIECRLSRFRKMIVWYY